MIRFTQTISAQTNLQSLKSCLHNLTRRPTEWFHDKWNLRKKRTPTIALLTEAITKYKNMITCKSLKHIWILNSKNTSKWWWKILIQLKFKATWLLNLFRVRRLPKFKIYPRLTKQGWKLEGLVVLYLTTEQD